MTLHVSYLSQGLPGPDGPAGEKAESVSAANLFTDWEKVWLSLSDNPDLSVTDFLF